MGRSSKFAFPLAGRKASSSSSTLAIPRDEQSRLRLTKAERLLGASGIQDAARQQLSPRPSYMSLNPSISEIGDEDYDDFSNPDHFGLDPLPLRLADLEQTASSEATIRRSNHGSTYTRAAATSFAQDDIRPAWSSSTLKSHYDANKLPLSISQQTSNSAVRDRALRKELSPRYDAPAITVRRPCNASAGSNPYDSQEDMSRATALPNIGRSNSRRLYANPNSLPPSRGGDSVASIANAATPSLRFPGAAPASNTHQLHGAANVKRSLKSRLSVDAFPQSMKLFSRRQSQAAKIEADLAVKSKSRKPRVTQSSPRNWWDGLVEEEDDFGDGDEHDLAYVTPTTANFPPGPGVSAYSNDRGPELPLDIHGSHVGMFTLCKNHSANEITMNRSSATLRVQRPHTAISRSSKKDSRLAVTDLAETSILSTSSSEGESEVETESSDEAPACTLRESIAISDIDDVHIGHAEALRVDSVRRASEVTPQERRPSLASVSSNPTTADSSSARSAPGPAYLSVPLEGKRSRKSGHIRQPSSIPEDSDTSSHVASPASPRESMRGFSTLPGEQRKLMEVSAEEEALLELMRRKRADKAALRDSGLASIQSSSTTRSTRPFSHLSASSSILDSFPISRSQRSSLMACRVPSQTAQADKTAASKKAPESLSARGRKRQSSATSATSTSYHTIQSRLESPSRTKYAFTPHLSLASLDGFNGLRSPSLDDISAPSPEPLDSPRTPMTRRGSTDVIIKTAPSQRNSSASYAYGEHHITQSELIQDKLRDPHTYVPQRPLSCALPDSSPELDKCDDVKRAVHRELTPPSSDGEAPVPTEEAAIMRPHPKRTSSLPQVRSQPEPTPAIGCTSACSHFSHGDSAGYNRNSVGYGAGIGTRCSVSEDVLAAWGSLGGWRDTPGVS